MDLANEYLGSTLLFGRQMKASESWHSQRSADRFFGSTAWRLPGQLLKPRLSPIRLSMRTVFSYVDWQTKNDYSVYVMRQASRRSWRIGQTRPVKVVFMSYRNTLQADALKLVAKKLQSSLAVEGELPEDGLAVYGDDGDDLMMALARRIVSGDEETEDAETVEEAFAQARDAEADAEEYLVDDGWKAVAVEPEAVAVNGNGHDANGHDDLFGVGPAVELAPVPAGTETGPTATTTTARPTSLSGRWSPGPSSWQGSRRSRGAATASPSPQASRCSSGRWSRSARRRRSAPDARPQLTEGGRRFAGGLPRSPMDGSIDDQKGDQVMARVFVYDDREFPDPDPAMTVDQVKATLADFYGEIANASVKKTKRGNDTVYEFQRRVGTKGRFTPARS